MHANKYIQLTKYDKKKLKRNKNGVVIQCDKK